MTTISVIIPTYNRAQYISDAIDSVLLQKLPKGFELEVIVVDNGSTDNTAAIMKKYEPRVAYLTSKATGRPATPRNIGIAAAKGELIAFQDSDDLWVPGKLLAQLPAFDDKSVVLCYANAEIMNADGVRTGQKILNKGVAKNGSVFDYLLQENFVSTLTVIVRKSALQAVGNFNDTNRLRAVEDYHLWLRIAPLGKFKYVDQVLALYRKHDQNISPSNPAQSQALLLAVYRAIRREMPLKRGLIDRRLAKTYADYARFVTGPKKVLAKTKGRLHERRTT